jgi:hypothetical protein
MADLGMVKSKVQGFLAEWGASLYQDGYKIDHESATLFIRVVQREDEPDGKVLIYLISPFLWDVTATPEVFKYVALHADDYRFGHLSAAVNPEGSLNLVMSHTLLGDYLDQEELDAAVGALLISANDLDDELQKQFGGTKTFDDK